MKKILIVLLICAATAVFGGDAPEADAPMTHHMMLLVMQLGVIIFAAKAGGLVFSRFLKMPSVLGELCAGILIGPFVLGGLALPGFPEGLFHSFTAFPVSAELYGIATVASIILLFLAGLETDLSLFLRFSVKGSVIGIGGVVGSFFIGNLTAVVFSSLISPEPIGFGHPIALFLGTISTATSVGITARVLSEKRKMDSPEGVCILAGAVIDDVLGIIILAVVLGIATLPSGGTINWGDILAISAKAVGFWLGATALGLIFARRISRFLKNFSSGTMASMALGLTLLLAGFAEMAGLAMIIGAYIMGLSLSRTDIAHELQDRLAPLYQFFVPIFFTVMGMLVDFTAFSSWSIVAFGLIYSAGAVLSKMLGASLPSLLMGFNARGAFRIGLGMVPRGEVALIIAGIGLSAAIIPPSVFGIAVMMTLITTVIAPPWLIAAFKSPRRGTRLRISTKEAGVNEIKLDFQSIQTTSLVFDRVIQSFRDEEFFAHLIDRDVQTYSIRKDDIIVTLRRHEKELVLDVHERHVRYVKFVLSEAIIGLMDTMQEIQQASDLEAKPRELLSS